MKPVKREVFGSRPSVLEDVFIDNDIKFIKNFWFVTCRREINTEIETRYLVFVENDNEIDPSIFKPYIPIYRVEFIDETVRVIKMRTGEIREFKSHAEFKTWIISKTKCRFESSSARGSSHATAFSRFFRENMGKGFSLTDIDFYIVNKKIFLEEKCYIENGKGYLGQGQYYSFMEVQNDVCEDINISIVLINKDKFYVVPLESINGKNVVKHGKWGAMVEFDLGPALLQQDIVKRFK